MSNPYKKCIRCEKRKVIGRHKIVKCLEFERFSIRIDLAFFDSNLNICDDCTKELVKCASDSLYKKGLKKEPRNERLKQT